jgi:glutamate-1-semialdehyde 2,1-aminomutase
VTNVFDFKITGEVKTRKMNKSKKLFEEARKLTPSGVHSDLRFFYPYPIFVSRANGAKIYDADENEYIDYHLAFGPVILGHCNPLVAAAVEEQIKKGIIFGLNNELEVKVAKKITTHVPSAQMVRFCNTGTEATYHAIRVARAFTGRQKIVKFEGAYHGWHDYVAVSTSPSLKDAGPKENPVSVPDTEGLSSEIVKNTIVARFNDPEGLEAKIKKHKNDIAALITEPILHGNSACITPEKGFLEMIREITSKYDIILIFDEVVTGFRHNLGGAQKLFNVTPDLTTFGKGMANGFAVAAVAGRKDVMERFKPTGTVEYGGTFNGNPVSMAATLATIGQLENNTIYDRLFRLGERIRKRLNEVISDKRLKAQAVGFGSIFQLLFTEKKVQDYRDVLTSDSEEFKKFHRGMMSKGVFVLPHAYKRCHLSAAHTNGLIEQTIEAARQVLGKIKMEAR